MQRRMATQVGAYLHSDSDQEGDSNTASEQNVYPVKDRPINLLKIQIL